MLNFYNENDPPSSDETDDLFTAFESTYADLYKHMQMFDTWLAIKNVNTPEINELKLSLESDLNMYGVSGKSEDEIIHIAMEGVFENIKGHLYTFSKMFSYGDDKAKKMATDVNRLKSIVNSIEKEKSGNFESTRISRAFGFDGKPVNAARVDEVVKNEAMLHEFLKDYYDFTVEAIGVYEHWVGQNVIKRFMTKKEFAKKMSLIIKSFLNGLKLGKIEKLDTGGYVQISSYHTYGLRFKLEYVNLSDESAFEKAAPFKLSKLSYAGKPRSETESVDILSKNQMLGYLKHIETQASKTITYKDWENLHRKLNKLSGVVKKLKADDAVEEGDDKDKSQKKRVAKLTFKIYKEITNYSFGGLISIHTTVLKGNTILMYYIEESVKRHNKG